MKKPTDATLRNVRAAAKRDKALRVTLKRSQQAIRDLKRSVAWLERFILSGG
jgi:hypothetical protein